MQIRPSFVGREPALQLLDRLWARPDATLLIPYGRRGGRRIWFYIVRLAECKVKVWPIRGPDAKLQPKEHKRWDDTLGGSRSVCGAPRPEAANPMRTKLSFKAAVGTRELKQGRLLRAQGK